MNVLDYRKRNLINEDYWGREKDNQTKQDLNKVPFAFCR
jgi:hypothetical protein